MSDGQNASYFQHNLKQIKKVDKNTFKVPKYLTSVVEFR